MINFIRRMVTGPSHEEIAAREYAFARRALLEAQSAEEFARSQVRYNLERIARLRAYLADSTETDHAD